MTPGADDGQGPFQARFAADAAVQSNTVMLPSCRWIAGPAAQAKLRHNLDHIARSTTHVAHR
jgi:hypothetical protein